MTTPAQSYTHYACGGTNIWEQTNPPVTFPCRVSWNYTYFEMLMVSTPVNGEGLSTTPDCSSPQKGQGTRPTRTPGAKSLEGAQILPSSSAVPNSSGPPSCFLSGENAGAAQQVFLAMLATLPLHSICALYKYAK